MGGVAPREEEEEENKIKVKYTLDQGVMAQKGSTPLFL